MRNPSHRALTVAVCGEKGGIGKSSTVAHLAASAAARGYLALCVDFDPQGALSRFFGADNEDALNVLDVLHGNASAAEAVQMIEGAGVGVIVSNSALSAAEDFVRLDADSLSGALKPLKRDFDFIFIDTEPEPRNRAIVAALSAADRVILPVQAEPQPVDCLARMIGTVAKVKGKAGLEQSAVLITKHFPRCNVYKSYEALVRRYCDQMGVVCLDATVRFSVAVVEAQAAARPLGAYRPRSPVARDYERVVDELFEKVFDRPLEKGEING